MGIGIKSISQEAFQEKFGELLDWEKKLSPEQLGWEAAEIEERLRSYKENTPPVEASAFLNQGTFWQRAIKKIRFYSGYEAVCEQRKISPLFHKKGIDRQRLLEGEDDYNRTPPYLLPEPVTAMVLYNRRLRTFFLERELNVLSKHPMVQRKVLEKETQKLFLVIRKIYQLIQRIIFYFYSPELRIASPRNLGQCGLFLETQQKKQPNPRLLKIDEKVFRLLIDPVCSSQTDFIIKFIDDAKNTPYCLCVRMAWKNENEQLVIGDPFNQPHLFRFLHDRGLCINTGGDPRALTPHARKILIQTAVELLWRQKEEILYFDFDPQNSGWELFLQSCGFRPYSLNHWTLTNKNDSVLNSQVTWEDGKPPKTWGDIIRENPILPAEGPFAPLFWDPEKDPRRFEKQAQKASQS